MIPTRQKLIGKNKVEECTRPDWVLPLVFINNEMVLETYDHAVARLEREQLQVKTERLGDKLIKAETEIEMNAELQQFDKKRAEKAMADKAKLVEALESASQALHYVLGTRDHFAITEHVDAVLKELS